MFKPITDSYNAHLDPSLNATIARWSIQHDTLVQGSIIVHLRPSNICGEFEYTCCFRYLYRKKSNGVRLMFRPIFLRHRQRNAFDEAHFWLNGYVNKQNCRIWSEANPQVYVETPLHPEKLTVWCALWAGGILLQKR
ncbi:hypothetical protein TNCV_1801551 [Trichonephila clavipes]|nr:hypothetical protein TNCV_1801551 [Trichonephila clavipes]